jgi:hypothetical protein
LRQQDNQEDKTLTEQPEDQIHFKLKIPADLHSILKIHAIKNKRTLSAEILKRVEDSFDCATHDDFVRAARFILAAVEEEVK